MKKYTKKENLIEFTALSHCALALSKDKSDLRMFTKHIMIEETRIVGTDGRRCHIAENITLCIPVGLYSIEKKTKSEIIINNIGEKHMYPNYMPLFDTSSYKTISAGNKAEKYQLFSNITIESEACFNYDYFEQAVEWMDNIIQFDINGPDYPVVLNCEGLKVALMPMKR